MKKNKTSSFKKFIKKIGQFKSTNYLSKLKFTKLKSFSFISEISKRKRYKNILEKINQFKDLEIKNKKEKKIKKSKNTNSAILKTKIFKKILEKINKLENLKIKIQKYNKSQNSGNILKLETLRNDFLEVFDRIKNYKFSGSKFKLAKNKKSERYQQKIAVAFYGDHNLIIVSANIDLNNNIKIIALNEIPVPSNVIGDSLVEDTNELANILLDSLTLLELLESPLLFVLSSSFFNIHTFNTSDLKQISQSDKKVESKSPYLPANTLVDFLRMNDVKLTNGLVRTIYAKKDFIKSWTDTLEIVNLPIIGLVPASVHVFDSITSKITEEITVLLDIESSETTLLIGSNLARLNSYKLPFGYSLYITDNLKKSSKSYFERALNSVKLIMKDSNQELPLNIFVMGKGLDKLYDSEINLPKGFQSISNLNLANYLYKPQTMQIHEIGSQSIENSLYSLVSILSSCV